MEKYGVLKRGGFDENGMPCNWHIDMSLIDDGKAPDVTVLTIRENGDVLLRGEFSAELTAERNTAMAHNSPAKGRAESASSD